MREVMNFPLIPIVQGFSEQQQIFNIYIRNNLKHYFFYAHIKAGSYGELNKHQQRNIIFTKIVQKLQL